MMGDGNKRVRIPVQVPLAGVEASEVPNHPDFTPGRCPKCREDIVDYQHIVKPEPGSPWAHALCVAKEIEQAQVAQAWSTLARHVAVSPSRHSTATIRAILLNMADLVGPSIDIGEY